ESFVSVPSVLGGDPAAGLSPAPASTAGSGALTFWVITAELALLVVTVGILSWWWRRWGPGRVMGMATGEEAGKVLGLRRLRRSASVVRPDLYGKKEARGED